MNASPRKPTPREIPEICDRCQTKLDVSIMSKFNDDTLCERCADDERLAPGYAAASEAEIAAVGQGDFNFPGMGLSDEDRAFLADRRKARHQDGG